MRLLLASLLSFALAASCAAGPSTGSLFSAPRRIESGGALPNDVLLVDMSGDGHLDILSANVGSRSISVLLGDGKGGFAAAPGSPVPISVERAGAPPADTASASASATLFVPHLMAAADFDGDGGPDLALTSHDHNEVVILRGDGAGGFAPFPASPVRFLDRPHAHNHGLAAGDVNADGWLDLATVDQDDKSVSIVLGDGSGGFTPAAGSPFAVGGGSYPLALADLNGDRALDIVTPNVTASSITVLLGDGRGGFAEAPGSPHAVHPRPYFIAIGRLDGDSTLDVVASHDDSDDLSILLGDGAGGLGTPRRVSLGGRGWKVRIADMNGDGRSDLVTGIARGSVVVLLGDGSGGFRQAPGSPIRVGDGPWGVAVGDVNRDGRPDVVTANLESNDLSLLVSR